MSNKTPTSQAKQTEIIINDLVKVTIVEESFNATGEMSVEYDETKITESEATKLVNDYFSKVLNVIGNNEKTVSTESLNEIMGEAE